MIQFLLRKNVLCYRTVEEIECEVIDDFDYRVRSRFDGSRVKATVERNEFDLNIMPKDLFAEAAFQIEPYTLADFNKGRFEVDKSLTELTGNADDDFLCKKAFGKGLLS